MKPRFKHYCDSCTYFGYYNEYDVYMCSYKEGDIRTLIFRYGDKYSEYKSNPLFVCACLTEMDKFALYHGIELNSREEQHVIKMLKDMFLQTISIKQMKEWYCLFNLGSGNFIWKE